MLSRIHLQNFVISTAAEVELDRGMTVLTGETGAGKSILIDALNLVLGDRADTAVVRHGTDRASIHASFVLNKDSPAIDWLRSQEMDNGHECHLRRTISAEGRSRAYINDTPVNLASLKTLGEMLVEIHGQHEHQSLMKPARQCEVLDNAGNHRDLLRAVQDTAHQIKQHQQELDRLHTSLEDNKAQLELLRYQTQELEALNISELNIKDILQEHEQATNAGALLDLCASTNEQLKENEGSSVSQQIGHIISRLEPWQETSKEIRNARDILYDINALIDEASRSLQQLHERLEIDPQRLGELDALVSSLHELSRKHTVGMESLPDIYTDKLSQLENIDQGEANLVELTTTLDKLKDRYHEQSTALHGARARVAEHLSSEVTRHMQSLGMQGGECQVHVHERAEERGYSRNGTDEVSFMVSANPGQPLQPLQKVASGGELSRISLAITVVSSASTNAPTMIFDEVDSGIGGGVAEIVGRELHALGQGRQVLCVTHLPQVAAQGHHHFRIVKTSTEDHTESRVIPLEGEGRTQEIARMLGGVDITEQSLEHARELLGEKTVARVS